MKWLRGVHAGREVFGLLDGGEVVVHAGDLFDSPSPTGERLPLAGLDWLTPCRPSKMIALWNNFAAAAEKNGWSRPAEPLYFLKAPNSFAAHGQAIPVPNPDVGRIAYEGELAIVIGRRAKAVTVDQAAAHIFGYSCANDVTAMELIARDPSFAQWARAKSFDGFGLFGPIIETDFDPTVATLRTTVGGRERQNYPLADMFFTPAELVSRLSHDMTLEPGDVILCGTSLGVLPMKPGTLVEVAIDGIGTLANVYGAG
ncbi:MULTISPECIES: fumarylacetoacetate hydrolase family protein [unclassified Rhizobacter]|uniref:fumarylacetoacetate hydrolase family protein n=1 Tax=unclassified Rhizobacter TaxID=2640088 RepID=UPI0006F2A8D0|nr:MULTISPECIES: fumarylacetoacetate hydrolase family protein [unclassified Rhizobacter]KQU77956.1 2-hydroxyhepta-2,4-diene-1,7-dioate isomerase [Rhizobacter sp. Root29]KQW15703.1 2-hydroxyhepta-2,4-diene-1,7-dioate isomerase [Rhizobacter sp. Root1238]KRB24813.1 2-hydroxyhepta-2,4-diene-1,7-dioate isomerase [Rhizobacter sp. Root16D2]